MMMADISNDQSQMVSADQSQINNNINNNNNSPTQTQQQQQQQNQQQNQQQQQQQNQQPPYTVPGILHYLQYEWHRFEVERQEWEVERAELVAQIALLKGEKKSHDNLKHDLIRRIKMLEYCLRMERAKYHKLKHGTDPPPIGDPNTPVQRKPGDQVDDDDLAIDSFNVNSDKFAYGRSLLKHYLEEVGSTDNYIGLRSSRVRSLVGIQDNAQSNNNNPQQQQDSDQKYVHNMSNRDLLRSYSGANNDVNSNNYNRSPNTTKKFPLLKEKILSGKDSCSKGSDERAVLATFDFLYRDENKSKLDGKDDDDLKNDDDENENDEISEEMLEAADRAASDCTSEYSYFKQNRQNMDLLKFGLKNTSDQNITTENSGSVEITAKGASHLHSSISEHHQAQTNQNSSCSQIVNSMCPPDGKNLPDVLDIGELATLSTLDSTSESTNDDFRRKQWSAKFRLQSHYDCVRDIKFVPDDTPLIVTVSEDETIKLWHLSKASSNSGKSRQPNIPLSINAIGNLECTTLDLEPIHTYRGHTSQILCLVVDEFHIYTGAKNGELFMWKILKDPSISDQYDKFKKSLLVRKFSGHTDAIWAVEKIQLSSIGQFICSAGADQTIKFWDAYGQMEEPFVVIPLSYSPTCMIWAHPDLSNLNELRDHILNHHLAVASNDGKIRLYDIESIVETSPLSLSGTAAKPDNVAAKITTNMEPSITFELDNPGRINSLVMHPRLPYLVSADSNHDIKFWNLVDKKCIFSMVAHLNEVTSLAIDRNGKYLLSGSHDCSVRLWLIDERSCIQEITSHRKKFDEGIFAVAFHQKLPHFATAGADGLAKVFV